MQAESKWTRPSASLAAIAAGSRRIIAIAMVVSMSATACSADVSPQDAFDIAERLLASLGAEDSIEPDEVLLSARTHLELAQVDRSHLQPASVLLDRLAELSVRPGEAAWGLSFASDAFADGSINPPDTTYSYTTASVGLAYMDGYAITGKPEYLSMAKAAMDTITTVTCCWTDGPHAAIWYSDSPSDQTVGNQVHNVSALTLALMMRLEVSGVDIDRSLADKLAAFILSEQGPPWDRPDYAASSNWPYSSSRGLANDLLHEAFILEGLARYPSTDEATAKSLAGILNVHFDNEGFPDGRVHTMGTRGWGPPAALYVIAGHPDFTDESKLIASALIGTFASDGSTSLVPGGDKRALGWYALSFARFGATERGHMSLTPWG